MTDFQKITIAQMFKSLTGKDMTAEERTKMDAEFTEFYAKKAEAEKNRLPINPTRVFNA